MSLLKRIAAAFSDHDQKYAAEKLARAVENFTEGRTEGFGGFRQALASYRGPWLELADAIRGYRAVCPREEP